MGYHIPLGESELKKPDQDVLKYSINGLCLLIFFHFNHSLVCFLVSFLYSKGGRN